ncbi:16929_t:CDS:2, partial [Racocetra persica]
TSNNTLGISMAKNNSLFDKPSSIEYKQGLYRRAIKELKITKSYSKKKLLLILNKQEYKEPFLLNEIIHSKEELKKKLNKVIKDLNNRNILLSQNCTNLNNKLDEEKRLKLETMLSPALQDPTLCKELNKSLEVSAIIISQDKPAIIFTPTTIEIIEYPRNKNETISTQE